MSASAKIKIPSKLIRLVGKWDTEYRKSCFRLQLKTLGPYVHLTCKFKKWDVFNIATHKKMLEPESIEWQLKKLNTELEENLDWYWYDIWKNCDDMN